MRSRTRYRFRHVAIAAGLLTATLVPGVGVAADGGLIERFGENGTARFVISEDHDVFIADVIGHGDRIVVTGHIATGFGSASSRGFVARVERDGTLDESFGDDGIAFFRDTPQSPFAVGASEPRSIAPLNGGYLVSGYFLSQQALGVVASDGRSIEWIGGGPGPTGPLLTLPDGQVVASGFVELTSDQDLLHRVLPSGELDERFDGSLGAAFASSQVNVLDLVRRDDGSIVALLLVTGAGNQQGCALAQFDALGRLDPSFGDSGVIGPYDVSRCRAHNSPDGSVLLLTEEFDIPPDVSAFVVGRTGALRGVEFGHASMNISTEGIGRIIAPGVGATVESTGLDAASDPTFGMNGIVETAFVPDGVRALFHGDVVAWGTDAGTIQLSLIESPWGPAPQPFVRSPAKFVPLAPERVLDTRDGVGIRRGTIPGGGEVTFDFGGALDIPLEGVVAVVMNLTVTEPSGDGFVTAYPSGATRPVVSNVNYVAGETAPNLATVRLGDDGGVTFYAHAETHLVADLAGYYVAANATSEGRFEPLEPARLLDTREGIGAPIGRLPAETTVDLDVLGRGGVPPSGVSAVALNVTLTEATADGFVTVWPGASARPIVSNINVVRADTRANLVIVPVGADGTISIFTQSGGHLVADVAGWFTDESAIESAEGLFVPAVPTRILDSRLLAGEPLESTEWFRRVAASELVPPNGLARAVVVNATLTEPQAPAFLTLFPGGSERPTASNLNVTAANQTRAGLALVGLRTDLGVYSVGFYANAPAHVIFDLAGWYTD